MDSSVKRGVAAAGWVCTIAALLAVVQWFEPPERNRAWLAILDAGHAPLFGAIALAILRLLVTSPLANQRKRLSLYGVALVIAVLLGVLSELLQIGDQRNSDPWDVATDAAGAGSFLLFAATFDPRALRKHWIHGGVRALYRGAALILLAAAWVPGVRVARAYAERASAFPALCDFAGTWESAFVTANHAKLEYTTLTGSDGERVRAGQIIFEPTRFAGFKLLEPYPDWTGYRELRVVIRSDSEYPIDLILRVHDREHTDHLTDRFNRSLTVQPGTNEFIIPLADIRMAPESREMDLSQIRGLSLFSLDPAEPFSLYLIELRLI